jgi:hypothetical protein
MLIVVTDLIISSVEKLSCLFSGGLLLYPKTEGKLAENARLQKIGVFLISKNQGCNQCTLFFYIRSLPQF